VALSVAEQQSAANDTTASLTFTLAAGSAVDDLLVLICADDFDTVADLLTPTGTAASTWTLRDTFDGGTNLSHIKVWTAPVTTAGAQTVIANVANATLEKAAGLWRIPGAQFDVANHANGTTSTAHVAPSLTPATTDEIYCCLWTNNDAGAGIFNYTYPSSPFVAGVERDISPFVTYGFGYEPITSGTATGTRTATASVTHPWCAAAVLVKPLAPAATDAPPAPFAAPGLFTSPGSVAQAWAGTGSDTTAAVLYPVALSGSVTPAGAPRSPPAGRWPGRAPRPGR
jgi:hypothetical protein